MAEIDKGKSQEMTTQEIDFLEIKPNQESAKFVDPRESALADEALAINGEVKQPFAAPFGSVTVAFIFWDIGN
jgi:hypothetical protein